MTCKCGHDHSRHKDAALAPECLDCDCSGFRAFLPAFEGDEPCEKCRDEHVQH